INLLIFFFFQAEDGIRDRNVTGVQTCALPILTDQVSNTSNKEKEAYKRQKRKEAMQKQLISFSLMIGFTLIAFAIVATDSVEKIYIIPILFLMAIVQAGFQFYYFMHLKDKGHEMQAVLIYGGDWAAFLILEEIIVITWLYMVKNWGYSQFFYFCNMFKIRHIMNDSFMMNLL